MKLKEGIRVETSHGSGVVAKLVGTRRWSASKGRMMTIWTVAVDLDTGGRRCYALNQVRPCSVTGHGYVIPSFGQESE